MKNVARSTSRWVSGRVGAPRTDCHSQSGLETMRASFSWLQRPGGPRSRGQQIQWLMRQPSSLCPHAVEAGRELHGVTFIRALILFIGAPPLWPRLLLKAPAPHAIPLGSRPQRVNLVAGGGGWGHTHLVHSTGRTLSGQDQGHLLPRRGYSSVSALPSGTPTDLHARGSRSCKDEKLLLPACRQGPVQDRLAGRTRGGRHFLRAPHPGPNVCTVTRGAPRPNDHHDL